MVLCFEAMESHKCSSCKLNVKWKWSLFFIDVYEFIYGGHWTTKRQKLINWMGMIDNNSNKWAESPHIGHVGDFQFIDFHSRWTLFQVLKVLLDHLCNVKSLMHALPDGSKHSLLFHRKTSPNNINNNNNNQTRQKKMIAGDHITPYYLTQRNKTVFGKFSNPSARTT